jgi:hypothetical protein
MPTTKRKASPALIHIAEQLRPLAVPITDLVLDPANPFHRTPNLFFDKIC